jgi:uncharacterized protein YodC (DUF2158 family)
MDEVPTKFLVGDVVRLVSGGHAMTIEMIVGEGAYCTFHGKPPKGWHKTEYVSLAVLVRVEDPEAS